MYIGGKFFDTEHEMYIMGILNVTPDSFSDGGTHNELDAALMHTQKMISEGADIIDVGGESTRPGYVPISDDEEIERVVPIIEAIKARFDVTVSVDTYKSKVAKAAIVAGADLVNDIWGLKYDDKMAEVIAKSGVACCLMHNRKIAVYNDFIGDVVSDLEESVQMAIAAGIAKDKILLDPGVGFAKDYEQNLCVINNLEKICDMGYPVLLGTSRKSVIGLTLDVPAKERVTGTVATTVVGAMKGCAFFRVHDCLENAQAIKMVKAIREK